MRKSAKKNVDAFSQAAMRVLDAIKLYREDSPQYAAFQAIDSSVMLGQAINELTALYSPGSILPDDGALLSRKLIQSSTMPDPTNVFAVFDHLDSFERWIISYYKISITDSIQLRISSARNNIYKPDGKMKDSANDVYESVGSTPKRGPTLAKDSGYMPDYVRHILADLVVLDLVLRTKEGYVRQK